MRRFDYDIAFARNRGLVSEQEQRKLRAARVLIVGMGGVGGLHATTLARLGVGRFRVVDPDTFGLANFNRQQGATIETLGAPKASTMAAQIRAINPEAEVEAFDLALDEHNVDNLMTGVDLVVDGIDFFALSARLVAYGAAWKRAIPVVSSGPIGMSATMHIFARGGMSFQRYFDLRPGMSRPQQLAAFMAGVAPRMSQRPYIDMSEIDVGGEYGPSLGAACMLSAGVVGVESLRLLLGRPGARLAPHYFQFDAYRQRLYRGYLRGGNRHPMQRLKRFVLERMMRRGLEEDTQDAALIPRATS